MEESAGVLRIAVCNRSFDEQGCPRGASEPAVVPGRDVQFPDLEPGSYAVAVYQDLDGSGALNRNGLGLPTEPYGQQTYVVCLDLGSSGAIFARGWNPQLEQIGELAKATKRQINTVWIYPPAPDRAQLFAAAPAQVMDLSGYSVPMNAAAA